MNTPPAELTQLFEKIRTEQGEAACLEARKTFVLRQLRRPGAEEALREWFPDLDIDALKNQVPQASVLDALQGMMPGVKTEAQARLAVACFESLKAYLEANFNRDMVGIHMTKDTLDKALGLVANLLYIEDGVQEIPEEQRSSTAQSFISGPGEQEQEVLQSLLEQISGISTTQELQEWYKSTATAREKVVALDLRNQLFDAIRAKRRSLE